MCFTSKNKRTKIAKKPIRVYKQLLDDNESRFRYFKYHKGINKPSDTEKNESRRYNPYIYCYEYTFGWLHAYMRRVPVELGKLVVMYIPKGTEYKDDDITKNYYIISRRLYWPKNIFERIYYWLISKHYNSFTTK